MGTPKASFQKGFTHIVPPGEFVGWRIGLHCAVEEDVVALLKIVGVEHVSEREFHRGGNCDKRHHSYFSRKSVSDGAAASKEERNA